VHAPSRPHLRLPSALVGLALCAGLAAGAQEPATAASVGELGPGIAARAQDAVLTFAEFDELALRRHTMSETGRAALKHLVRARLLERLAEESRLVISEEDLERRWEEVSGDVDASGDAEDLEAYLRSHHVAPETFREFLRLGMVQEILARRALGIPEGQPINAEKQEMWLDQIVEQRGTDFPLPPWDGPRAVVGRCGDVEVRLDDFLPHLRAQIPLDDVRADCYQLLLQKRLAARMPDLSEAALQRAVDQELERRRAEFTADPSHAGVSFDQVMNAKGMNADVLHRDPAIVIAALSHLWLERTHGEEGMREAYRRERAWFDGRFGESVEVAVIFLRAAVLANQLNPRTYDEAEQELARLAEGIATREDFAELARTRSEDAASRAEGGSLGRLTRHASGAPEELLGLAFANPGAGLVGPVRLPQGVVLAWIGERFPAPGWEVMREHVSNELRRRFLEETLPEESVVTWLEVQ